MIEFSDLPISTQISSSTSFAISRATLAVICTLDFIQNKVDIAEKRGVKAMLPRLNCSRPKGLSVCLSSKIFCRNLVKTLSALIWPFDEKISFSRKTLLQEKYALLVHSVFLQKRTFLRSLFMLSAERQRFSFGRPLFLNSICHMNLTNLVSTCSLQYDQPSIHHN